MIEDQENFVKEFRILVGGITYDDFGRETIEDGLEFGNLDQCIALTNVEGLEIPPIRSNNGDWSGRDGGYMSSQLYGARVITLTGFYWDNNYACSINSEVRKSFPYSIRERITNWLMIRHNYPIFIKFISGRILYTSGYLVDLKMPYDFVKSGEFQATFYCPDYQLSIADTYGDPESIWHDETLYKEVFGGHLVPEDLPVLFEKGQHPTTIYYDGIIPTYPIITLAGPAKNPMFYNTATNKYIRLGTPEEPWTLQKGQILTINMRTRQVTVNGKSVSMSIDQDSDWWSLIPGPNKIYFLNPQSDGTATANIRYSIDQQGCQEENDPIL